jgi:hypothetical protein
MFDRYVFTDNSCKNIEENGKVAGFELETLITYYRGVPLSMVYNVSLTVDGIPVPRELIRVSLDRDVWFTLPEAETVTSYKWEYGESLVVRALVEGGLRRGEHDVKLFVAVYPSYYPFPAGGEKTRKVLIK